MSPVLAAAEAGDDQTLHFVETERAIELTVPAGGISLVVPREGFKRVAPVVSGAPGLWTFDLVNEDDGIEIFGAFDAAARYPGVRGVWAEELQSLRIEEAPQPSKVRFSNEGIWELISYEIERPNVPTSYLRAETVKGDVWIDVQVEVSADSDAKVRQEIALEALRGLLVREDFEPEQER